MNVDDLLKLASKPPRTGREPIGDSVLNLRGLTAGDLYELQKIAEDNDTLNMQSLIVAKAAIGDDGEPLFGDVKEGARKLAGLPAYVLMRLSAAVDRLSDVEPGGTAELLGNSGARMGDLSSVSP